MLYLPALLGGPEQVSSFRETAGGDSRCGDLAAPAAAELNYVEKQIEKYLGKVGRLTKIPPLNEARRRTALDERAASRGPGARDERRLVPIMGECKTRIEGWLRVTDYTTWGAASPFDLL